MSNIKSYWADVAIQFDNNKTAAKFIENYEKRRQSLIKNPTDNNYDSFFENDNDSDYPPNYTDAIDDAGFYVLKENIDFSSDIIRNKALLDELATNNYNARMLVIDQDAPHYEHRYEYGPDGIKEDRLEITKKILIPQTDVIITSNYF